MEKNCLQVPIFNGEKQCLDHTGQSMYLSQGHVGIHFNRMSRTAHNAIWVLIVGHGTHVISLYLCICSKETKDTRNLEFKNNQKLIILILTQLGTWPFNFFVASRCLQQKWACFLVILDSSAFMFTLPHLEMIPRQFRWKGYFVSPTSNNPEKHADVYSNFRWERWIGCQSPNKLKLTLQRLNLEMQAVWL